jgi:hypothetical protein
MTAAGNFSVCLHHVGVMRETVDSTLCMQTCTQASIQQPVPTCSQVFALAVRGFLKGC